MVKLSILACSSCIFFSCPFNCSSLSFASRVNSSIFWSRTARSIFFTLSYAFRLQFSACSSETCCISLLVSFWPIPEGSWSTGTRTGQWVMAWRRACACSCSDMQIQCRGLQSLKAATMEPPRSNRYRSTDNFPQDHDAPSILTAFLRSSRSPSFLEAKTLARPPPPLPVPSDGDELRGHYEVIERVLNDQNANLKKQAKYLASEMRKSLRREKAQREDLAAAEALCVRTEQRLAEAQREARDLREFVETQIVQLLNALKLAHPHDLQEEITRIVQQLCEYFNINLEVKLPLEFKPPNRPFLSHQPSLIPLHEEQVGSKIEELNRKFQSLMTEYKSTSRLEIRKQCIDIAKEIKQLKAERDGLEDGSRMEKTVQNLSRIHSQDHLSLKSKNPFHLDEEQQIDSLANTEERAFKRLPSQIQSRHASRQSTQNAQGRPSSFPYPYPSSHRGRP